MEYPLHSFGIVAVFMTLNPKRWVRFPQRVSSIIHTYTHRHIGDQMIQKQEFINSRRLATANVMAYIQNPDNPRNALSKDGKELLVNLVIYFYATSRLADVANDPEFCLQDACTLVDYLFDFCDNGLQHKSPYGFIDEVVEFFALESPNPCYEDMWMNHPIERPSNTRCVLFLGFIFEYLNSLSVGKPSAKSLAFGAKIFNIVENICDQWTSIRNPVLFNKSTLGVF